MSAYCRLPSEYWRLPTDPTIVSQKNSSHRDRDPQVAIDIIHPITCSRRTTVRGRPPRPIPSPFVQPCPRAVGDLQFVAKKDALCLATDVCLLASPSIRFV